MQPYKRLRAALVFDVSADSDLTTAVAAAVANALVPGTGPCPARIDLGEGGWLTGVESNGDWTSAAISIYGSNDDSNYHLVKDQAGNQIGWAAGSVATSGGFALELTKPLTSYRYIKLISGTAVSGTAQAADRLVYVLGLVR